MAQAQVFDARTGRRSEMELKGPRFETELKEHVIHLSLIHI